MFNNKT